MAKTKMPSGVVGKILELTRIVASTLVGIPTALAATVVVGTLFFAIEAANIVYSHATKNSVGLTILKFAPALAATADFLKGTLISIWRDWGIYPYLQGSERLAEALNNFCSFEAEGYRDRIANPKPEFEEKEEERRKKILEEQEALNKHIAGPEATPEDEEEIKKRAQEEVDLRKKINDLRDGMMQKYKSRIQELDKDDTTIEHLYEMKKESDAIAHDEKTEEKLENAEAKAKDILEKAGESLDPDVKAALEDLIQDLTPTDPKTNPTDPSAKPVRGRESRVRGGGQKPTRAQ